MKSHSTFRKTRSWRGGFFLLEAIVALGIFAIAILGLAGAVEHILDAEKELRLLQRTRIEMESHLAEAAATRLQPGTLPLESRLEGVVFERAVEIIEPENRDRQRLQHLFKITVVARRKGGASGDLIDSASVLIYQPR